MQGKIYNLLTIILFSYFATYVISFGSIFSGGVLGQWSSPFQFSIFIILDILLLATIFKITKINIKRNISKGFKFSLIALLVSTILLSVLTYNLSLDLGPTEIKIADNVRLVKPNQFLININIISLTVIGLLSFLIGFFIDKSTIRNKDFINNYIFTLKYLPLTIIFNFLMFPILNILLFLIGLSTGG